MKQPLHLKMYNWIKVLVRYIRTEQCNNSQQQSSPSKPSNKIDADTDIYALLAKVSPAEKREIIVTLRGSPPIQQLNLPKREDGTRADLSGADLGGLVLSTIDRRADLRGANLEKANLTESGLRLAQLQKAYLVKAILRRADLRDAHLEEAWLAEADLINAYLDDAHLEKAKLGFAKLQGANLTGAYLEQAELWQANLRKSNLLRGKLKSADLHGADLRGANFLHANLECANLQNTNLQGVDLSQAMSLTHIHISGAQLADTRLRREQLGDQIGEEVKGQYKKASDGYRILKQNFEALGDYSAASWAYVKEKQMEKKASAPWRARRFYGQSQLGDKSAKKDETISRRDILNWYLKASWFYVRYTGKWLSSLFVEVLCNYGESWGRVIVWISIILLIIGPYLLWWTGGLFLTGDAAKEYWNLTEGFFRNCHLYKQFVLYMLDVFTTASFSSSQPITDSARFLSGCIAFIGILLTGLLGFVVGNRIRHS
jgi:uncharacterized protein YjbI with pentapeptide repeats